MIRVFKKILPSKLKSKVKSFINFLIPNNKNQVLFYSIPDFSDNAKAVYNEMIKNNLQNKYKLVWIVSDIRKYKNIIKDAKIVKRGNLQSFVSFCRSQYIFSTHSFYDYKIKRQVGYQLWHGNGLKVVKKSSELKGALPDYVSISADIFKVKWPSSIIDENRVLVTGLPRNDEMFKEVDITKKLNLKENFKKIILWMPTFRTSKSGTKDGTNNEYAIPLMSDENFVKLNNSLKELNIILLIKIHSYSYYEKKIATLSNVLPITDETFSEDFTLYNLIGNVDSLLTDYSSVYVDYLLMNKPIGFVYEDLKEYRKTRGFIIKKPKEYMPGEHIHSLESLVSYIEDVVNNVDKYEDIRKKVIPKLNKYTDNQSSKRVLQELGLLDK